VFDGAAPSLRKSHVMTSVGLDLWLHGGWAYPGDGDYTVTYVPHLCCCCCCCAEAESVPLYTFSDCVCCGVCTDHDLCVYVS
jgi:hypothetical protein